MSNNDIYRAVPDKGAALCAPVYENIEKTFDTFICLL